MLITPPTPLTPIMGSQMSLDSTEASTEDDDLLDKDLLEVIQNLHDKILTAHVLEKPSEPMPHAPQLHVLPIYARLRLKIFQ